MWTRLEPTPGRAARALVVGAVAAVLALGGAAPDIVDAAGAAAQGRQGGGGQGRGGRGGPPGGAPIAFDNHTGFRPIFDGRSLDGWDGDPAFWRVENGAIVGQSTPEKVVEQNTFLIWRGGTVGDFDLKLEFRLDAGNSGVQYRSEQLPEGGEGKIGRWVLKGYQADIDFANQYTGMLYEERGRGFLAPRGQFNYIGPAGPDQVRGQVGALNSSDALRAQIKQNDWNQFQVTARGNVLIHVLNGHVTALFVDDDQDARAAEGLLGLQIHTGPPMKVEFRNVYLRAF